MATFLAVAGAAVTGVVSALVIVLCLVYLHGGPRRWPN